MSAAGAGETAGSSGDACGATSCLTGTAWAAACGSEGVASGGSEAGCNGCGTAGGTAVSDAAARTGARAATGDRAAEAARAGCRPGSCGAAAGETAAATCAAWGSACSAAETATRGATFRARWTCGARVALGGARAAHGGATGGGQGLGDGRCRAGWRSGRDVLRDGGLGDFCPQLRLIQASAGADVADVHSSPEGTTTAGVIGGQVEFPGNTASQPKNNF